MLKYEVLQVNEVNIEFQPTHVTFISVITGCNFFTCVVTNLMFHIER